MTTDDRIHEINIQIEQLQRKRRELVEDNPDYPIDWSEQDRMAAESERLADHPFSGNGGEY